VLLIYEDVYLCAEMPTGKVYTDASQSIKVVVEALVLPCGVSYLHGSP